MPGSSATNGFGLFDHNTLTDVWAPGFHGEPCVLTYPAWTYPLTLGTANALFIEDNHFVNTMGSNTFTQPDAGCSANIVFRYNFIDSYNSAMHGIQGGHRGTRSWEFYGNVYTSIAFPTWVVAQLRGGTGVVYNNKIGNGFGLPHFILDNPRSFDGTTYFGLCDGTSTFDGDRTDQHGYPCRDQIGRSTDAHQMSSGDYPAQSLSPAYFWNNKNGATEIIALVGNASVNQYTYHIRENRDFYNYNASFNGTAGVGSGLLANRPTTCTTNTSEAGGGVAYWATDTNTLYRCSAKHTWTVHYKPYTYPHPLQNTVASSGGTTSKPSPPKGLRIMN